MVNFGFTRDAWSLGFGVWGLGFRVGFRGCSGQEFRVKGLGVWGLGFRGRKVFWGFRLGLELAQQVWLGG